MKVLAARYHQNGSPDEYVVVGRVVCHEGYATVHPDVAFADEPGSRTLVSNLKYLALMSVPPPFELLRGLDSIFWTFVEADGEDEAAGRRELSAMELK